MIPIRVLVVDDHDLFRAGVRATLRGIEEIRVTDDVSSAEEAIRRIEADPPDILLADISMKGMTGLELAERVRRDFPAIRVIILSMHAAREYAVQALRSGASGYLLKDAAVEELERAIRAVARGESYLSTVISGHLVADYARLASRGEAEDGPLTARQREVLRLIAEGMTTKAIARRLEVSIKTVDTHRSQIMDRLGIRDIAGLVRYAVRVGLVSPGE
ncbi:response regulator [Tautonia plasticadhaerens]|uniref:Oxygen regulatory protein NreC n=1 Tax=Tautonia plasticadhaerens TaxID=2527974 RepID=A0A518GZB0_9BACT|nr:response regulator transcription factor [Tautonia plasticadhaerens]QDV33926.1 Oxygen regulatory protein NreC [Tautonia plasticadhaerens]